MYAVPRCYGTKSNARLCSWIPSLSRLKEKEAKINQKNTLPTGQEMQHIIMDGQWMIISGMFHHEIQKGLDRLEFTNTMYSIWSFKFKGLQLKAGRWVQFLAMAKFVRRPTHRGTLRFVAGDISIQTTSHVDLHLAVAALNSLKCIVARSLYRQSAITLAIMKLWTTWSHPALGIILYL